MATPEPTRTTAAPTPGAWALLPRRLLALPVQGYRLLLSPWLGSQCRFEPTCSRYALQALAQHGALAGGCLAAGRILRCHPWCAGGCDPVPQARPRLFRHLLPQATLAGPVDDPAGHASSSMAPTALPPTPSPDPQTSTRP